MSTHSAEGLPPRREWRGFRPGDLMNPDAQPSPPEFVNVTTADGVCSRLGVFRPQFWPRALVVCLPALGVAARYYRGFASALAERRIMVVTADFRGNGTSSVRVRRGVDFGY